MFGTKTAHCCQRVFQPDISIYRLKNDFPRMNATQIYDKLVRDSFIPATVSVDSVQRFIRHNDLKSARYPNLRDRKAFEEDSFGKIWQADTCYLPYITEDGKTRRVYCIMIIDDHSRLILPTMCSSSTGKLCKYHPFSPHISGRFATNLRYVECENRVIFDYATLLLFVE